MVLKNTGGRGGGGGGGGRKEAVPKTYRLLLVTGTYRGKNLLQTVTLFLRIWQQQPAK